MRKGILVAGILVLLLTSSTVMAGDIDGIWLSPDLGLTGAVMVRENGGTVVAIAASLAEFGKGYDYSVLIGSQTDNTISLQDYDDLCGVSISVTMTLTSPTTAIVKVNHCSPKFAYLWCFFPSGVSFDVEKIF
jgi:hypothetical protein